MPVLIQDFRSMIDFNPAQTAKGTALHPGRIELRFLNGTEIFIIFVKGVVMTFGTEPVVLFHGLLEPPPKADRINFFDRSGINFGPFSVKVQLGGYICGSSLYFGHNRRILI